VTNPTHLAIALEYNPPAIGVPLIVARAADANAVCVRRIAREAHVPIVEAVELARLLYSQAEEGDPIPLAAYGMVAPIIASVLQAREIR
jgi:flagellar biosynthesis protein FlhB